MKSGWIALGVLMSITLLGMCDDDDRAPTPRPTLVWNGREYTAAWRTGSDHYIQLEGQRARRVYSNRSAHSQPTLHRRPGGYALGTAADEPRENDWRSELMIWLDHAGHPAKRPVLRRHVVSADRLCNVRQTPGDPASVTGVIGEPRGDGRAWYLGIGSFDDEGEPGTSTTLIALERPISCTVASRGNVVVWAVRYASGIHIHFHDLRDLKRDGPHLKITDVSNGVPWDLSLIPAFESASSFAILHRDSGGDMRVTHFNASGVLDTRELSFDVDSATADIGASSRGLFVTWLAARQLHVRGVTSGFHSHVRVPARSGIRAAGLYDHCTVAIRPPSGNSVRIERFEMCP